MIRRFAATTAWALAMQCVVFVFLGVFGMIATSMLLRYILPNTTLLDLSEQLTPAAVLTSQSIGIVAVLGSVWLVQNTVLRSNPLPLPIMTGTLWRDIAIGSAIGALPIAVWLLWLQAGIATARLTGLMRPHDWFAAILLWVLVGYSEEIWVRGFLFAGIQRIAARRFAVMSEWIACFSQAMLFAVLHAANPSASVLSGITIFVFGIAFGVLRMRSQSLVAPISVHIVWNASQYLLGLPVSGILIQPSAVSTTFSDASYLTGGAFGLEASIFAIPCVATFLFASRFLRPSIPV